jgi:crotonobetainyl-CoA:carnitine CoA-transferase CaiB-like acyl-CoA transferase
VLFCCMESKFWTRFCERVGRSELLGASHESRFDYGTESDDLRMEVQKIIGTRTLEEWMAFAVAHDLPIGPAHRSIAEVASEPQFASREIFVEGSHPVAGEVTYIGTPAVVDGQPYTVRLPAPGHGEHTDEVLRELGYADSDVAKLRHAGVTK